MIYVFDERHGLEFFTAASASRTVNDGPLHSTGDHLGRSR